MDEQMATTPKPAQGSSPSPAGLGARFTVQSCLDRLLTHLEIQYYVDSTPNAAARLHPLHQAHPRHSRELFDQSIRALRRTLLLASSAPPPNSRRSALLREWATSDSAFHATRRAVRVARRLPRGSYPSSTSSVSLSEIFRTLEPQSSKADLTVNVLIAIGRNLNLDVFKDDMTDSDGLNLSMAGKTIVFDITVNRTSGFISSVAFTCGTEETFEYIDRLLMEDLNGVDFSAALPHLLPNSAQDPVNRSDNLAANDIFSSLHKFRKHLRSLLKLDVEDEREKHWKLKAFRESSELSNKLFENFYNEMTQAAFNVDQIMSKAHGIVLKGPISPHSMVVFHVPFESLSSLTRRVISPSSPEDLLIEMKHLVSTLDNALNFYIMPRKRRAKEPIDQPVLFTAHLENMFPISSFNGKKLMQHLEYHKPNGDCVSQFSVQRYNRSGSVWLEELLVEKGETSHVWHIYNGTFRYELANAKHVPGFMLREFTFTTLTQLLNTIGILKRQAFFNDVFRSIFKSTCDQSGANQSPDKHISVYIVPENDSVGLSWQATDGSIATATVYPDGTASGFSARQLETLGETRSIPHAVQA